jgi:hypothetical protein
MLAKENQQTMKLVSDKNKQAPWAYDLRVRERLLVSGALEPKTVERYLAELPDLEAHAENLAIEQPALADDDGEP